MEELLGQQNDNLGNDVASKDGMVKFRNIDVVDVPYLQENESGPDPFLGIDWKSFQVRSLKGRWMKLSALERDPQRHTVFRRFLDSSYNFVCYDPRRCFLGAKSTWHV
jgi:hypothetical protein